MVRITNKMMANNLLHTLNANMRNLEMYQKQLSNGRKINKPSDDPAGAVKSLRLRTSLNEGEQYLSNIGEATSYMQTTDDALMSINEIMQKVRELTVKAGTGTNDSDAQQAIATEIRQLNEQLKMVANTTYGSKYIFAGTNVTEAPYDEGEWTGNSETLNMEISAGVKMAINIPAMQEYFTGRLNDLYVKLDASFIKQTKANNLQEGAYQVSTSVSSGASSSATEVQNYLHAVPNNGEFFYTNNTTAATLGIGTTAGLEDSHYSGSLLIETKYVGIEGGTSRLKANLDTVAANDSTNATLNFGKAVYYRNSSSGELTLQPDADLTTQFDYQDSSGNPKTINSATYTSSDKKVVFDLTDAAVQGDTIILNDFGGVAGGKAYDQDGNEYLPVRMVFDGTEWVYDDVAPTATVETVSAALSTGPVANLETGSTVNNLTLNFNEALYTSSDGTANGIMTALTEGADVTGLFTYTGSGTFDSATYHTDGTIDFIVSGTGAVDGDSLKLKTFINDPLPPNNLIPNNLFDSEGKTYSPTTLTYTTSGWVYPVGYKDSASFNFDKPLYDQNGDPIVNGDMTSSLIFKHADGTVVPGAIGTATYSTSNQKLTFTYNESDLQVGDTVILDNNAGGTGSGKLYNQCGVDYVPVKATWDGSTWQYDAGSDKVIVDIKGNIYRDDGSYKYVEMKNVELNMTAAAGEALFTIPASKLFESPQDPAWEDLVIWNNSDIMLGGIDTNNPQLVVGDKAVIGFSAQEDVGDQSVEIGYTYKDINGNTIGTGSQKFVFNQTKDKTDPETGDPVIDPDTGFPYQVPVLSDNITDFSFFTLNEEVGVDYNGDISLKMGEFPASGNIDSAVRFDYQAGLFSYVEDLCKKIEIGKLPQVGNELAGNDTRMNELLLYRSTLGARINRLDLQQSRLEYTQESLTGLLSQNEDANEAEVITNLQLQENVYQAALAAGAKIIQPSLIDFLS